MDHPGVPNPQLIKEDEAVAAKYKYRSVAEQKSLDIAMALINEDRFAALRAAICQSPQKAQRFRQLVVNVSATRHFCCVQFAFVSQLTYCGFGLLLCRASWQQILATRNSRHCAIHDGKRHLPMLNHQTMHLLFQSQAALNQCQVKNALNP